MKTIVTIIVSIVLTTLSSVWVLNRYMRTEPNSPAAVSQAPAAVQPAPRTVEPASPTAAVASVKAADDAQHRADRLVLSYDRMANDLADISEALGRFNTLVDKQASKLRQRPTDDGKNEHNRP